MAMRINPDDMKPTYQIDDERDEPRKIDHEDTLDYTPDSEKGGKAHAEMTPARYRLEYERLMPQGAPSDAPQFSKLAEMEQQTEGKDDRAARKDRNDRAQEEQRFRSASAMAQELNRGLGSHSMIDEIHKNGAWEAESGTTYSLSKDGKSIVSETRDGDRDIAEIRDIAGFIDASHEIELEQVRADGTAEKMAELMDRGDVGQKTMIERLQERGEGAEWNDRSNGITWSISEDRKHVVAEYQEGHERAGERDVAPIADVAGIIQERHDGILERRAEAQSAYEAERANNPKPEREQTSSEKDALFMVGERIEQFRSGQLAKDQEPAREFPGDDFAADMSELSEKIEKPADAQEKNPQGETVDVAEFIEQQGGEYVENTRHQAEEVATAEFAKDEITKEELDQHRLENNPDTDWSERMNPTEAELEAMHGVSQEQEREAEEEPEQTPEQIAADDKQAEEQRVEAIILREEAAHDLGAEVADYGQDRNTNLISDLKKQGGEIEHNGATYSLEKHELVRTQDGQQTRHDAFDVRDGIDLARDQQQQLEAKPEQQQATAKEQGTEKAQGPSSIPEKQPEAPAKAETQEQEPGLSKQAVNSALMDRIKQQKGADQSEQQAPKPEIQKSGYEWADNHNKRVTEKEATEGKKPDHPDVAKAKAAEQAADQSKSQTQDRSRSKDHEL